MIFLHSGVNSATQTPVEIPTSAKRPKLLSQAPAMLVASPKLAVDFYGLNRVKRWFHQELGVDIKIY
jgi:hypothetical protein